MNDELDELTKGDEAAEAEPVATGEKDDVATPATSEPEPTTVPVAALLDERSKRQAVEQRLAEIEAQSKREVVLRPDANEDPEGAATHLEQKIAQGNWETRVAVTRSLQMSLHDDYAEKEATFHTMAGKDPLLVDGMFAAEDPARFVYETVTKHETYEAIQNIDEYREKIRAEERDKLKAELKAEGEADAQRNAARAAATGVPSLATVTGGKGGTATVPTDDDLNSVVLGDKL